MARVAHVLQYPRPLIGQVVLLNGGHITRAPLCRLQRVSVAYAALVSQCPLNVSASLISCRLNDFRVNGVPSSIESEAGNILRALHGEESLNKDLVCVERACDRSIHPATLQS